MPMPWLGYIGTALLICVFCKRYEGSLCEIYGGEMQA